MARFHIGKSGKSAACNAKKGNCPLGGDSEHFSTREEANKAAEKKMSEQFQTVSSAKKKTPEFKIPNGTLENGTPNQGLPTVKWTGGNLIRLREELGTKSVSKDIIKNNMSNDVKNAVKTGHLSNHYKYSVKEDNMGNIIVKATAKNDNPLENHKIVTNNHRLSWDSHNDTAKEVHEKLEEIKDSYHTEEEPLSKRGYLDNYYSKNQNFKGIVEVSYNGPNAVRESAEKRLGREFVKMSKEKTLSLSDGPITTEKIDESIRKNPKIKNEIITIAKSELYKESQNTIYSEIEQSNQRINQSPEKEIPQKSEEEIARIEKIVQERKESDKKKIAEIEENFNSNNPSIEKAYSHNPQGKERLRKVINSKIVKAQYA